jgi:hypothetical protein
VRVAPSSDHLPRFAIALAGWSLIYLVPHLYWALGGTAGFSALKPSAVALTDWQAINWAATVVLAIPALIAAGLSRARPGWLRTGLLLSCLLGAAIATAHGLYGIVYRFLTLAGVVDIDGQAFDASRHGWVLWDLLVFEPWFLVEGLLFVGIGWAASRPASRRRWLVSCALAVTLATISGLVGVRV